MISFCFLVDRLMYVLPFTGVRGQKPNVVYVGFESRVGVKYGVKVIVLCVCKAWDVVGRYLEVYSVMES